jgi:TonB family protein
MRRLNMAAIVFFCSLSLAQTQTPQTARQALIEMFFGSSADHLEKHLPDITRRTLQKIESGNGQSTLAQLSMLATLAKAGGAGIQTFDTGPVLLKAEDSRPGSAGGKLEVTVERDDLSGDEDQIDLAFHVTQNGKQQSLPFASRFTFTMKMEADVWRLNEISVTVRLPLDDPEFLKSLEERSRTQNEQAHIWAIRSVNTAEASHKAANGSYACDLGTLGKSSEQPSGAKRMFLYDMQLASGKKDGYIFAISSCDNSHYKIAGEPATPGAGQRAFCSDESGSIRVSADGKATTCLSSGVEIEKQTPQLIGGSISSTPIDASRRPSAGVQRVRVSQGVMKAMVVSQVDPVYPPMAQDAGVQGSVVMAVIIGKDGSVQSPRVLTTASPLLNQAAIDAVKQWKYRPYLLNGNPVEVDTTVTVTFPPSPQ